MTRGETILMWVGRVITAVMGLGLIASGVMKFMDGGPQMEEGLNHLGFPKHLLVPIGVLEIACALIYLFPPTSLLGAILIVGYMGGAIFAHLRVGDVPALHVVIGVLAGLGIYLREPRLWRLLPVRTFCRTDRDEAK